MSNNLIPVQKFKEAQFLISKKHVVQKIEHNKHNSKIIIFYFEPNNRFFEDWNYIKEN